MGFWAAAGPAVAQGGISLAGGIYAAHANAEEASKNRRFQKDMSNTEWQRGVKDMTAAGMNPMLGFSQGGASTPSGSQAHIEDPSAGVARSTASAIEARFIAAQTDKLAADTELVRATTQEKLSSASQMGAHSDLLRAQLPEIRQRIESMRTEQDLNRAKAWLTGLEAGKLRALLPFLIRFEAGKAAVADVPAAARAEVQKVQDEWQMFLDALKRDANSAGQSAYRAGQDFREYLKRDKDDLLKHRYRD